MHRLFKDHGTVVKSLLVVALVLVMLAVTGIHALGLRDAQGASDDTEFKVTVTAAQADGTDPVSTGEAGKPIAVNLRDSYSSGPQTWTIGVSSVKQEMGRLSIKFVDTDPDRKVKEHLTPTSVGQNGPLEHRYYPDMFTQLRFEVLDGDNKVWDGKLGTDGEIKLDDPNANAPAKPGYLKMNMPLDMKPGGPERKLTLRVYMDSVLDQDDLSAYNGTTTGLSLIVKGETR